EADVAPLPQELRSVLGPFLEQSGFLGDAVALWPTPLRPIGGQENHAAHADEKETRPVHPVTSCGCRFHCSTRSKVVVKVDAGRWGRNSKSRGGGVTPFRR